MARYTLNELRQMDEAQALSTYDDATHAAYVVQPIMAHATYAELKREGREDPNPCPMAKRIATRRHNP